MPLVSRTANQGNVFKQDAEPGGWQNGDIWSDTDDGLVYNNVSGTATLVGKSNFSDSATVSYSETIGDYTQPTAAVATSDISTSQFINKTSGGANGQLMYAGAVTRRGNLFTTGFSGIGDKFQKVKVNLIKVGSPTGNLTLTVRNSSDTIKASGTLDVSTLDGTPTLYEITLDSEVTLETDDRILAEYSGGDISNHVQITSDDSASISNVSETEYNGSYTDDATDVTWMVSDSTPVTAGAAEAIDDNTSTYWQSDAETNPAIYVDAGGSATNLLGIAIYLHANTTETEIQLRASADTTFSSGEATRTITVSNLTAGAWNYIRWNLVNQRYIQIYGNSGSSAVLAISEIKYLTKTDSQILQDLAIIEISPTDTSLALDGT